MVRNVLRWLPLGVLIAELTSYFTLTIAAGTHGAVLARNDLPLGAMIAVASLVMSVVGRFIVTRQPRNAIGWLFAIIPCGFWVKGCSDAVAFYAHFARHDAVAGGVVAAWMSAWDYLPPIGTLGIFVPLLYPNGRLPSKRWRIVLVLGTVAIVGGVVASAFSPGKLASFPELGNPFAPRGALGRVVAFGGPSMLLLPISFLLSASSLWFRARSGTPILKEQVKWFAYAGAIFAIGFAFAVFANFGLIGAALIFGPVAALPIACAVAITRYRLFEIDRLISRTLTYAVVTGVLVGVAVAIVLIPTTFLGSEHGVPSWLVALATLVAAMLFRPVLNRVRNIIDRRFNRTRYDSARTVEAFASRLRDEIDMETLTGDLEEVVRRSMQPTTVSVWLRPG